MSAKMNIRKSLASVVFGMTLCAALSACAAPVRGPEAWLEFMGGNVRMDGLRRDLQAIKDAGISGVQFFHIQRGGVCGLRRLLV